MRKSTRLQRDLILIAFIILVAVALMLAVRLGKTEGEAVSVSVNGETVAEYSLLDDGEYQINDGSNILKIQDGMAFVIYADCPDKLCQHSGKIHLVGERIVCLPNKIMIEVTGADDGMDFVS